MFKRKKSWTHLKLVLPEVRCCWGYLDFQRWRHYNRRLLTDINGVSDLSWGKPHKLFDYTFSSQIWYLSGPTKCTFDQSFYIFFSLLYLNKITIQDQSSGLNHLSLLCASGVWSPAAPDTCSAGDLRARESVRERSFSISLLLMHWLSCIVSC